MMRLLLLLLTSIVSLFSCVPLSVGIYLVPHGERGLQTLWGKHWPSPWWSYRAIGRYLSLGNHKFLESRSGCLLPSFV